MTNDPEKKQPSASPPEEQSPAPEPPAHSEDEFPPDLEWQVRAHPAVPWKPPPPPPGPPASKKEAPPAAAAKTAAPPPESAAPAAAPEGAAEEKPKPAAGPPRPATGAPAPKPAAPAGAAPPPRPPAPPKEAPPKPEPFDSVLVKRFKTRFGDAIREAWTDRKQVILVVLTERLREIAQYAREEEKFDFLTDVTAVDWPKREKRFDVVLNLYSFAKQERLRLKAHAAETEAVPSVTSVWPAANWLEREVFDMFGIRFDGHPNLKRILLPDEWQGYPLRKDYDILRQDEAWVHENLGIESGQ